MFINDTDLFTRFVDTFFVPVHRWEASLELMQRKLSPSNTAVFSGKRGRGGVSIETVLNFCLQFNLLNIVDKLLILIAK